MLNVTHDGATGAPDWIDRIASRGPDGIVLVVSDLTGEARARLAKLKVPVVAIDPQGSDTESFATVSATD